MKDEGGTASFPLYRLPANFSEIIIPEPVAIFQQEYLIISSERTYSRQTFISADIGGTNTRLRIFEIRSHDPSILVFMKTEMGQM